MWSACFVLFKQLPQPELILGCCLFHIVSLLTLYLQTFIIARSYERRQKDWWQHRQCGGGGTLTLSLSGTYLKGCQQLNYIVVMDLNISYKRDGVDGFGQIQPYYFFSHYYMIYIHVYIWTTYSFTEDDPMVSIINAIKLGQQKR